jgi:hypothetical protein
LGLPMTKEEPRHERRVDGGVGGPRTRRAGCRGRSWSWRTAHRSRA